MEKDEYTDRDLLLKAINGLQWISENSMDYEDVMVTTTETIDGSRYVVELIYHR